MIGINSLIGIATMIWVNTHPTDASFVCLVIISFSGRASCLWFEPRRRTSSQSYKLPTLSVGQTLCINILLLTSMAPKKLPTFDDLPLDKNGPPGNAWGLWGPDDQLGRLNLLTLETVRAAASEIREGIRISLDWPLDKISHSPFERHALEHRILNKAPMTMNDDVITLNTQSSTQWDGFRHYGEYHYGVIMTVLTVR